LDDFDRHVLRKTTHDFRITEKKSLRCDESTENCTMIMNITEVLTLSEKEMQKTSFS
jgi:hypothetical protein